MDLYGAFNAALKKDGFAAARAVTTNATATIKAIKKDLTKKRRAETKAAKAAKAAKHNVMPDIDSDDDDAFQPVRSPVPFTYTR